MEFVLIGLLAAWFLVSLLAQAAAWDSAPKSVKAIANWFLESDVFSIIPSWNFFAPNPGTTDYHLLYRDKLESGELSVWREIPIDKEPSLLRAVWNPRKRKSKVLSDVVSVVNQSTGQARNRAFEIAQREFDEGRLPQPPSTPEEGSPSEPKEQPEPEDPILKRATEIFEQEIRTLQVTIPYLIILNYLSHISHPVFSASTQFLLAETRAYDRTWEPQIVFISEFHKLP